MWHGQVLANTHVIPVNVATTKQTNAAAVTLTCNSKGCFYAPTQLHRVHIFVLLSQGHRMTLSNVHCAAHGILAPQLGVEAGAPTSTVLTTGPPGKSPVNTFDLLGGRNPTNSEHPGKPGPRSMVEA